MQDVGSDHRLLSTAKLGRTAWLSQSWNTMDCISRNDMCFPEKWTAILGGGRISLVSLQIQQNPQSERFKRKRFPICGPFFPTKFM